MRNAIHLRAVRLWLDWSAERTDNILAYDETNIIDIVPIYHQSVPSPYSGVSEVHRLTRVYLDDELNYVDLLYVTQAGQIALLSICADMTWFTVFDGDHA